MSGKLVGFFNDYLFYMKFEVEYLMMKKNLLIGLFLCIDVLFRMVNEIILENISKYWWDNLLSVFKKVFENWR